MSLLERLIAESQKSANKHKCFLSYYSGDTSYVEAFMEEFGDIFIAKAIGVSDGDDFINSDDTDYVMSKIREKYLGDSTVTICLIGDCTHSRRYIDWELKASLRRGSYTPNGLLGIVLPYKGNQAYLPPRFKENWDKDGNSYAIYRSYPNSKDQLKNWINDAYNRRVEKADLITNSRDKMKYNRSCQIHGETH